MTKEALELCCLLKGPGPCMSCGKAQECSSHFDIDKYPKIDYNTQPYRLCMKCYKPMCNACYNNNYILQSCCWYDRGRWTVPLWDLK